jgi:Flp pilus assembly protein TadB
MNAINTTEKATNKKSGLKKLGNIILKILLGIGIAAVVIFALVAIYKIIEFLFVAAILLIGWIGIVPRRWR